MTSSAPLTPGSNTRLIALLVIGSILLFADLSYISQQLSPGKHDK